jgi:hypothetical protein
VERYILSLCTKKTMWCDHIVIASYEWGRHILSQRYMAYRQQPSKVYM